MRHSLVYGLELQLKDDKKKWYVFAQGISPLFYRLEGLQHFRIYSQWIENFEFKRNNLTWAFLVFQQTVRRRLKLKTRVLKNLRKLETGEVTFAQLLRNL